MRPPLFEVTSAVANAAARRLTTAANVNAMLGQSAATDQTLIEQLIDRVSAMAARFCKLAAAVGTTPPTFGAETCRATWYAEACAVRETDQLVLPWRAPINAISSVVEDGVTLSEGTDFELLGGGLLQRLSDDAPAKWSGGKIVVVYTTGWSLPGSVPPEIEGPIIDQVKMAYDNRDQNPGLRSETINDVITQEFNVAGGSSIGKSGLLVSVESALDEFRDKSQG